MPKSQMFRKLLLSSAILASELAALGLPVTLALHAQILHATTPRPQFEVAIIKPSKFDETRSGMAFSDGGRGFTSTNATVRDLIQEAYNVKSVDQIAGATGWMTAQKFDIEARMEDSQAFTLAKLPFGERIDQVRLMLQSLLQERFALKLSESTRESSYFVLVAAKGGPKLKLSAMAPASADSLASPQPAASPSVKWNGPGKVEATGSSIKLLADFLSRLPELGATGGFTMGDLVVDKTGLAGMYDWSLSWAADSGAGMADGSTGPSLFTALQEQLGLKLERTKGTVEVLVIDHVQQPSEN